MESRVGQSGCRRSRRYEESYRRRDLATEGAPVSGIIENFKRGYEGNQEYQVAGRQVVCSHCGGTAFDSGAALLNTTGMSLVGLDWANRNATVLICAACSHIEWFLNDPDKG